MLTISSLLMISSLFGSNHTIKHKKMIDGLNLKNIDSVMFVAHPDDETIWGGSHLLKKHYLVVCITNGNNKTRRKEFMNVMKATHNTGVMFNYPDKTNGQRDNWDKARKYIKNDVHYILSKKKWKTVVTHNPDGEYGHIHHKKVSKYVTMILEKEDKTNQLVYFGKYASKKNKAELENDTFYRRIRQKIDGNNYYKFLQEDELYAEIDALEPYIYLGETNKKILNQKWHVLIAWLAFLDMASFDEECDSLKKWDKGKIEYIEIKKTAVYVKQSKKIRKTRYPSKYMCEWIWKAIENDRRLKK